MSFDARPLARIERAVGPRRQRLWLEAGGGRRLGARLQRAGNQPVDRRVAAAVLVVHAGLII
jgi:hypothetical protein